MIFRMKIEKGCLYSEMYRVQHCFSNWHLELKNHEFILDAIANYHHYINEITVSDNTELILIRKYPHLINRIKVIDNSSEEKENETSTNEIQENKKDTKYMIDSNKENENKKEYEELKNSTGRKSKKSK